MPIREKFWTAFHASTFTLMLVFGFLFIGVWTGHILTPQEQTDFLRQVTEIKK